MPEPVLYVIGVLAFLVALIVSVSLHELGHLLVAKAFGTRVTQYFVGFGKTLWSTQRGETEYGLKLIPAGGFVKILGMYPPAPLRETEPGEKKWSERFIASGRAKEYEDIEDPHDERLFYKLAWYKKVAVMTAGVGVNLLIAFLCFLGVFLTFGNPTLTTPPGSPVVDRVEHCLVAYTAAHPCPKNYQAPAALAGVNDGDKIVEFNGHKISSWNDLSSNIDKAGGKKVNMVVLRKGKRVTLTPTIANYTLQTAKGKFEKISYLGIETDKVLINKKGGPLYTLSWTIDRTKTLVASFARLPANVGNVTGAILGVDKRNPDGPVSIVGGSRFSGEVLSAGPDTSSSTTSNSGDNSITLASRIATLFILIGSFNLFIGLFNLFPLIPLDGGQMVGALIEGTREGWAKLRKQAKPAPFDVARMLPLAYGFSVVLFLVGAVLIIADFVVPISLSR